MPDISTHGFKVIRRVIPIPDLDLLRAETDRLATEEQSACVRHIRKKSNIFDELATSPALLALIPENLILVRSILFYKTPAQNWPVAWHQDLADTTKTGHHSEPVETSSPSQKSALIQEWD